MEYDCPFLPINQSLIVFEGKPVDEIKIDSGIFITQKGHTDNINTYLYARVVEVSPDFQTKEGVRVQKGAMITYRAGTEGVGFAYIDDKNAVRRLRRLGVNEIHMVVKPEHERLFAGIVDQQSERG